MPTNVAPEWFTKALESLRVGDLPGWMSMYVDDATHEFPFAPQWMPRRLEGKADINAYMATVPMTITRDEFTITKVLETDDELVVEGYVDGKRTATGTPFRMEFVWFLTHDQGRVRWFQDYMNPLAFIDDDVDATRETPTA